MYKYLAILLVAITGVAPLYAQKVELALGAGIVSNTAPNRVYGENATGGFSHTMSMKVMLNAGKHWQAGFSVGYVPLSYKADMMPLYFEDTWAPGDIMPLDRRSKQFLANPAVPVQLEVNYRFDIGKFNLYSGVSAGCFVIPQYIGFIDRSYYSENAAGVTGGMQFGAGWFFVPWCAINAQLGANYYIPYDVLAFPVTMGLRFRL